MEEIDFKELLSIFWRKKIHVIVIICLFVVLGCVYSFQFVQNEYKSSTTLILGRINSSIESGIPIDAQEANQITQSEITINSNLVSTYSELIKSNTLIKKVKDNLQINIDEEILKKSITVSRIAETELIEITVVNHDSNMASRIANEIATVFSEKIQEIYNISNVYIIDPAVPDSEPYNINHPKDIIIFTLIGLVVSCGYVLFISMLDTTIKTSGDIEKDIGLKTLVLIPKRRENKQYKTELVTVEDGKSIISESFKTLRTNVQFTNINNKENKVMLITSCFSSEGKSYISANLAVAFAQVGKKVILIDADMRRGRQANIFGIPNDLGLSNYLSNLDTNGMEINERVNRFINETSIKNLNVITAGNIPPNPSELLASGKLPELIKDLSVFYDLIIFDGPPVLPIADSLILARMASSTLLVSLANKTRKDELNKAKKDIQNVGGRIIGVVLNKVNMQEHRYESKYYYSETNVDTKNKKVKNHTHIFSKWNIQKIKTSIIHKIQRYKNRKVLLLLEKNQAENLKAEKIAASKERVEEIKRENMQAEKIAKEEKLKENIEKEKVKEAKKEEKDKKANIEKEDLKIQKEESQKIREEKKRVFVKHAKDAWDSVKTFSQKTTENGKQFVKKTSQDWKIKLENYKEKNKQKREENAEKKQIEKQKKEEALKKEEEIKRQEMIEKEKEDAILAEVREKERLEKEKQMAEEKEKKEALRIRKLQEKEEKRRFKEQEKLKQKEEARLREEILEDNLYPKTKYNKNL